MKDVGVRTTVWGGAAVGCLEFSRVGVRSVLRLLCALPERERECGSGSEACGLGWLSSDVFGRNQNSKQRHGRSRDGGLLFGFAV